MSQNKYFQKIIIFYQKRKRLPSYREIMGLTGFKSKNSVHKLIKKMIPLGLVEKDKAGKIIPGRLLSRVPLLGVVKAGFPSPAEEELADTIGLDDYLIDKREATYILEITGDSMTEAGILPGDLVLVERGQEPKNGDIVVAEVDHEWTVKYFRRRGSKVYLEAANEKYPEFYPEEELKIAATVRAVLRKYK